MNREYVFSLVGTLSISLLMEIKMGKFDIVHRFIFINACVIFLVFSILLVLTGNPFISAGLCCLIVGLFCFVSNAKRKTLGEPLVFSDLIVVFSFLRYPKFYLSAISAVARLAIGILLVFSMAFLIRGMHLAWMERLGGIVGAIVAILALLIAVRTELGDAVAPRPDLSNDVARMGLMATLVIYFLRWRREPDPAPKSRLARANLLDADIVCIIQCESFFDPDDIGNHQRLRRLPALTRIQAGADQRGRFLVDHFGAYTMRSEYGVLFGRSEENLGYRYFDPYITARREVTFSLANRLADAFQHRVFVHPHDLSFYNRRRLMPAAGFTRVIGPDAFSEEDCEGRYVGDNALANRILEIADGTSSDTEKLFLYAVTMENHGPWSSSATKTSYDSYLKHLESSDQMLDTLDRAWGQSGKKIVWIFYGDHRPSIPGVIEPAGERFTTYFIKSYGFAENAAPIVADIRPDELHEAILMRLGATSS